MRMDQRLLLPCSVLLVVGSALVTADTCPGGHEKCPDFMTCCKLSKFDDDFGCCPFPNAKCCPDRVHCCPHNMECDVAHQICVRNGSPVQFYWRVPIYPDIVEPVVAEKTSRHQDPEVSDLQQFKKENSCPDASKCHSTFTCCKMYSGKYGCCPFDNGTCCQDEFHCCPHGSECSTNGECFSTEMNYTVNAYPLRDEKYEKLMKPNQELEKPAHQDVSDPSGKCPDGRSCLKRYTCCKTIGKRYGCCPYTNARCCDDGIHCCPKGTNCNVTLGTCDIQHNFGWSFPSQALINLQWSEAPKAVEVSNHMEEEVIRDVICPDKHHCPSDSTCCELSSGGFGCCLMKMATCCPDKLHCCPHGYRCITAGCKKNSGSSWSVPQFLSAIAISRESEVTTVEIHREAQGKDQWVVCPDGGFMCPDGSTCCKLASGDYGCCPLKDATCCRDKEHCCPHGFWCGDDGCTKVPEMPHHLAPFLRKLSSAKKIMGN